MEAQQMHLALHSAAAHITWALAHNPTGMEEGWREPGRRWSWFVSLTDLHLQLHSSLPLKFPLFWLFSTTEDVTSMKCSLERVNFILLNVFVLDKHLGIAICLVEFLFPLDTGWYPASPFLQGSTELWAHFTLHGYSQVLPCPDMHAAATSVRCIYIQILQAFVWSNFTFPLQNQGCFLLVAGSQQLPQSAETLPKSSSCRNRKQARDPQDILSQR